MHNDSVVQNALTRRLVPSNEFTLATPLLVPSCVQSQSSNGQLQFTQELLIDAQERERERETPSEKPHPIAVNSLSSPRFVLDLVCGCMLGISHLTERHIVPLRDEILRFDLRLQISVATKFQKVNTLCGCFFKKKRPSPRFFTRIGL